MEQRALHTLASGWKEMELGSELGQGWGSYQERDRRGGGGGSVSKVLVL